jgi:DNA-binding SARP family transcriptional activator
LPAVQFGILGPLEVTDAGRRLDLGSRRQRQLLAVLLLEANRVVSLDRLIDDLWGDTPPNAATASIQAYVSHLRRVLEPGRSPRAPSAVLVSEPPGYMLCVAADRIDAKRCELLVEQATALAEQRAVQQAIERYEQALALWRGDPLAEFAYDRFALGKIEHLTELRVAATEGLIAARLALGPADTAMFATLERLVSDHPLRESVRVLQMLAFYRSGRQVEALQVYEDARTLLRDEMGLDPGPELRAMQQRVLTHDPALQPATRPASVAALRLSHDDRRDDAVAPPAALSANGFVGRDDALERLGAVLDQSAIDGRAHFALIGGEPGIGKTRLAEELCERAAARGALVVWGRCHDDDGTPPLWPWLQILRSAGVDRMELTAHARDALAPILPELDGTAPPPAEADSARFRLYGAVREVLEAAAAARPVVVVLDDVHWADASTLRLLNFLGTEGVSGPILFVALFHEPVPDEAEHLRATVALLARRAPVERTTLTGLSAHDIAALVRLRTDVSGDDLDELAETLHERTAGNAFFITELLGLLDSEHRLGPDRRTGDPAAIPAIVGDVVRRRLERLPDDARATLVVAAVIGREFTLDLVHHATGLDDERAFEAMEAALMTRTIVEVGQGRYRFAHGLVNETLYNDLSSTKRARLHARVASAIEASTDPADPERVVRLAHHFRLAGDRPRAARFAELAATRAERALAFDEAASFLRTWLQMTADSYSDDRVRILVRLANALRMSGDLRESSRTVDLALEHAVATRDPALVALVADAQGEVNLWQVRNYGVVDERAVTALAEVLDVIPPGDSLLRVRLTMALALSLYYSTADRARAVTLIRAAQAMARRLDDGSAEAYELRLRTNLELLVFLDPEPDPSEQLAALAELVALGGPDTRRPHQPAAREQVACLLRAVRVQLSAGDSKPLASSLDAAARIAGEAHDPVDTTFITWARASAAFLGGRYAEAEELARRAFEQHSELGIWGAPETFVLHMTFIWREQGRLDEFAAFVEPLLEEAAYPRANKLLGLFAAARGDVARVATVLGDDPVPRDRDFPWLVEACLTAELAALIHSDACAELYELLSPFDDRVATMDASFVCLGSVAHYLALLAAALHDTERAMRHARTAVTTNERIAAVPWIGRSRALLDALGDDRHACGTSASV